MSSRLTVQTMEEKLQHYWTASRMWRGLETRYPRITIGDLLANLADLAGTLNQVGWQRAESATAVLLEQVINNKRCRKTKPTNNIVNLNDHKAYQPRVLLDMLRAEGPEALIGRKVTLQIKQLG